jgi:bacteriocin-like protein
MQDNSIKSTTNNELLPIEGELTDEDLKQVSGGSCSLGNGTDGGFNQNDQGQNQNDQGQNQQ